MSDEEHSFLIEELRTKKYGKQYSEEVALDVCQQEEDAKSDSSQSMSLMIMMMSLWKKMVVQDYHIFSWHM